MMVFERPNKKLWRRIKLVAAVTACCSLVLIAGFAASVFVSSKLPAIGSEPHELRVTWLPASITKVQEASAAPVPQRLPVRSGAPSLWGDSRFLRTAFIVQSADRSPEDYAASVNRLDAVFPNWYAWTDRKQGLCEDISPKLREMLSARPVKVLPLISNADSNGRWHAKEVSALLSRHDASQALIEELVQRFKALKVAGINIDFESLAASDRNNYTDWLKRLSAAFHQAGMFVTVDVPFDDRAYDYDEIGKLADAVVVMAYDEHDANGKPGPIAGIDAIRTGLDRLEKHIPPAKMIVGIGAYGYDWDLTSGQPGTALGFADIMALVDTTNAGIDTEAESVNSHFSFTEPDGDHHEVWFLDAVSAWNELLELKKRQVGGFGLWRLGTEDPGVWDFLGKGDINAYDPHKLQEVAGSSSVIIDGDGEVYRIVGTPETGRREITFNGRQVQYAAYTKLPHYLAVQKTGRQKQGKKIALTFDDGPDPQWTPKILSLLREYGVEATFFLVGNRAQLHPDIVRQEYAQGNLIGNHTFLHPDIGRISASRLKAEVNATQREIESITGHQTALFRSPFDTDTTPLRPEQFLPQQLVSKWNYYIVGADIDSRDTEGLNADQMIESVLNGLRDTDGNIVVFHDWGKRAETFKAVQRLIPMLKEQGYTFVTVNQLMEMPKEALMPPAPASDRFFIAADATFTRMRAWFWPVIWTMLVLATGISIFRVLGLGMLIAHSAVRRREKLSDFTPPVDVIIPAYNEGKVIQATLEALLRSDYPNMRITVVDDGSTDDTSQVVSGMAALHHDKIELIRKANSGKSSSLNLAFARAREDIVVTIDADTIVLPHTIRHLVAPFEDSSVDAVCGNVLVGNAKNLLTLFQDIEYVTTQNYDRRAFEALNCITVVPGATGAWRRRKILEIGGYSLDTLTEDADLTITLLRNGGRIVYGHLAQSVTEVPEDVRSWFKQRFRWRFGMLQCLWKHRGYLGRGYLGLIALPNIFVQLFFELVSPLSDVIVLGSLLCGSFGGLVKSYILFVALDMVVSLVAFLLDRRDFSKLPVLLLHRFYYRPLLYLVTIAAFIAMLRGRRHSWNKLERSASVPCDPMQSGITLTEGNAS